VDRFSRRIFEASLVFEANCVQLALRGELDLASVPALERELERAEAAWPPLLLLDLAGVTFLDGAGMTALLAAARRAARRGTHLRVENPSAPIRRLFRLTAIDQSLEVAPA
jgi:stage II sporulation protein AA (anti-sigma F factor antagonist)